jgi:hypothetical protein
MDVEVSSCMTTMYCSLKEAYRTPDFDTAGKKRKSCATQGQSPADANDSFFPENGQGEPARYTPSYVEGFENKLPESRDKIAYRAQANDYDYYCKAYGVCPTTKVEGFENLQPRAKSQQCSPPTPQRYEVPISPEAKAAYDNAIKTSLSQGGEPFQTAPYIPERRQVDMEKVSGYYDEDLEQYLQMKNTPITAPPKTQQPDDTPFRRAQQYFEKVPLTHGMIETPKAPAPKYGGINSWQNVWDLLIFILAGVLIIVLCEQLFKVAMMVGMRRTIDILEPFLDAKKIVV